ncbi:MAG: hypothetical protein AAGC43_07085 [Bacteroidota bacterium]
MFKLTPVLDQMQSLYELPRDQKRFEAYLEMLQGKQKGNMILPIAGYNPMGKENVLEKIQELKNLNAEELIGEVLDKINIKEDIHALPNIQLVLNLADDVGGVWSNKCTVDYSSKFEFGPLLKRNFCAPYFWSSEGFTKNNIETRVVQYAYRTIFWIKNGTPRTLKDFVLQEIYVFAKGSQNEKEIPEYRLEEVQHFFNQNSESEEYSLLFNFFYGDKASNELNYPTYGAIENQGFRFSAILAKNKKWQESNSGFAFE